MKKQHWQDWVNLVLGLWVIVSPWAITHIMAGPTNPAGLTDTAMWNYYATGSIVAVLAVIALYAFAVWEEWSNLILGAWLLVSPWFLGFSTSAAMTWNAVIIGVAILVFAGWTLVDEQGPQQMAM